jgi:hypothetical protein
MRIWEDSMSEWVTVLEGLALFPRARTG